MGKAVMELSGGWQMLLNFTGFHQRRHDKCSSSTVEINETKAFGIGLCRGAEGKVPRNVQPDMMDSLDGGDVSCFMLCGHGLVGGMGLRRICSFWMSRQII